MMDLTPRELEQAKRCQLLAGSFEGNERCCPCTNAGLCIFSMSDREVLKNHPEVVKRKEENWALFRGEM